MLRTYNKPPLSFQDQLDRLKKRGLVVKDEALALAQLSSISYYRLSAYWYPFRQRGTDGKIKDAFIDGARFEDAMELYEFDRKLRLLVLDALERVEVSLRTALTYHLSHTYGALGYTDTGNFHPNFRHGQWLAKLEEEISRSSDAFILHYKGKYRGFPQLPIWMATEVMSLGSLSFLYKGLHHQDKKAIALPLGLHHKGLADWLHVLTYVRNVCAHHSRLWNRELSLKPVRPKSAPWSTPTTPQNDRIFYVLLMLRFLLKHEPSATQWKQECEALIEPIAVKDGFRIAMGMPENWQEHPLWK